MDREQKIPQSSWPSGKAANCLLLAAVTLVFFSPVFSHPAQMVWGSGLVRIDSAHKQIEWRSLWEWHAFPLWDPTGFCGRSRVGDQIPVFLNPLNIFFLVVPSPAMFGFFLWFQITLGAWGMFLFARRKSCDAFGAFFAAVAFALSGKMGGHLFAGHVGLVAGFAGLPWILWAAEILLAEMNLSSSLILGVVLCLAATTGSIQLIYWHILWLVLYVGIHILLTREDGEWRGALRVMSLFGVSITVLAACSAGWWFPIVRQTLLLSARAEVRDVSFAAMGSATPRDLLRFIWPFSGIPIPKAFVPDAANLFFWEGASYPGVTALGLALAGTAALRRERDVICFWVLALIALLASLGEGSPVYWLAYHVIPGFGKFRAPGRLLMYVNLAVALLAGLFLTKSKEKGIRWPAAVVLFVMLQAVFLATLAMRDSSWATAKGRWIPVSVLFALTVSGFFWASGDLSNRNWRQLSLGLLIGELLICWGPHLQVVDPDKALPPFSAAKFLAEKREDEEFRVLDTTRMIQQQIAARYGLEIISGYHQGVYAHQLDVHNRIWRHGVSSVVELIVQSPREVACPVLLDLMNVRYLVSVEQELGPEYSEVYRTPPRELRHVRYVYRRDSALPRAFLVAQAVVPPEGITVLEELCSIDPREMCLVEERPFAGTAAFQTLAVQRRSPSDLTIRFATEGSGVAVISQSWHPDWRATDNGNPVEVRRVNHAQVGIPLEPGDHELRVWYYPWDFYLGCVISALAWGGVALSILVLKYVRKIEPTST